ncbi:MAG: hypothetical protein SFW67_24545 [Myxococcaceae bacterium]|nr:hypothetical protein [Myxococcaceae bacterium]
MRTLCLVVCLLAGAAQAQGTSEYGSGLRWNLNPEGDRYIRAITWAQVWTRAIENNPGTTVDGVAAPWTTDVGLRRVRLLLYGQVHPRVLILTHLGINNQTFNNARRPSFFVHEAVVQFEAVKDALSIGAGLHYQNGISRMTSASTLNFLMMDAPIVNWPTIDGNDQFARNLGVYAKGKLSRLDYRIALNRPFTMATEPAPGTTGYNPRANTLEGQFYVAMELLDRESNVLPYAVGTYLGSKRVLNFGAGAMFQPQGMLSVSADGMEKTPYNLLVTGLDVFLDLPFEGAGALTAYAAWLHKEFGPNYLRNIGIMNVGAGGFSFSGGGNAAPIIGTGESIVAEAGYLLPWQPAGLRLQPYAGVQTSFFQALGSPSIVTDVGLNLYVFGHHGKVTINWKNRPIFSTPQDGGRPVDTGRRNEIVVQTAAYF